MTFFTESALDLEDVISEVSGKEMGAVVTFLGCVRDTEEGTPIRSITYEAYTSMANMEFKKLVEEIENAHRVKIALRHRVGKVPVSEASLAVACAGKHRKETF
ncbi:MAG: molybdenum cofactor biosynthesis protein MoaE, partial [Nitrospinota bacterium]